MTDKILILGYGRAGKRHARLAAEFGLDVYLYDPIHPIKGQLDGFTNCGFLSAGGAFEALQTFSRVVICTPPDQHLQQISLCLDAGVDSILCEKPLCAIGQLEQAKLLPKTAPVMMAYNYRYHPKLAAVRGQLESFRMVCYQKRIDLPAWGLLLDHCSHDLDIVRSISAGHLGVDAAHYDDGDTFKNWSITTDRGPISETVVTHHTTRLARVAYPYPALLAEQSEIDIDSDPKMFTDMWQAFLTKDYYPDLGEAIKTQQLLEDCYRLNKE